MNETATLSTTPEIAPSTDVKRSIEQSMETLKQRLLESQAAEGFWRYELECDITPTADYILLRHFLNNRVRPAHITASERDRGSTLLCAARGEEKVAKAASTILSKQNTDGSWSIYHGGPGEISATVKAYFALKLAGYSKIDPRLRNAADFIKGHGGVQAANSFMKFYLALFGQWPWTRVPAMPPELFLLPTSFPFHIYAMSSWSRGILVPMFILYAMKPSIAVPQEMGIQELTAAPGRIPREVSQRVPAGSLKKDPWSKFFYRVDFLLKGMEKNPLKPWRPMAVARCRDWILERLPRGQGLGSIWPAMVNAHMALSCLEFPEKQRVLEDSLREIEALVLEGQNALRVQPCWSAVWDTAIAVLALRNAGLSPDDPRLKRAGEWLLTKEVKIEGDWKQGNPAGEPGGWYFQFRNDFYPDTDDTAMVILALNALDLGPEKDHAVNRAVQWLLSMQNNDGGWGAFDKNNNRVLLTRVPFADHNAMIDPSSCDVTGRVLEALGNAGKAPHAAQARAFAYLRRNQEQDGTWLGRWGVNYIYGTWSVSNALRVFRTSPTGVDLSGALHWLRRHQNPDGGWGESCASYDDPSLKGQGDSTASQTSWALNTFFNADRFAEPAVIKGIQYLIQKLSPSGEIQEAEFTGTGFPRVFYLNYHIYRTTFPLIALARYRDHLERQEKLEKF